MLKGAEGKCHASQPDAMICSVGGGGLIAGIVQELDEVGFSKTSVLAIEPLGADSLAQSPDKGKLITSPEIRSIISSLADRAVARQAFVFVQGETVRSLVLTDQEAIQGCLHLADEERIAVEPACGLFIAPCYNGKLRKTFPGLDEDRNVVIVVSLELLGSYTKLLDSMKFVYQAMISHCFR